MEPLKVVIDIDNQQNITVENIENICELDYLISEEGINTIKRSLERII